MWSRFDLKVKQDTFRRGDSAGQGNLIANSLGNVDRGPETGIADAKREFVIDHSFFTNVL